MGRIVRRAGPSKNRKQWAAKFPAAVGGVVIPAGAMAIVDEIDAERGILRNDSPMLGSSFRIKAAGALWLYHMRAARCEWSAMLSLLQPAINWQTPAKNR